MFFFQYARNKRNVKVDMSGSDTLSLPKNPTYGRQVIVNDNLVY